jgi:hypothetical protein
MPLRSQTGGVRLYRYTKLVTTLDVGNRLNPRIPERTKLVPAPANIAARALARIYQAVFAEPAQCISNDRAGDIEKIRKLVFGRQPRLGRVTAGRDLFDK